MLYLVGSEPLSGPKTSEQTYKKDLEKIREGQKKLGRQYRRRQATRYHDLGRVGSRRRING
ncbi:MAG: hypothetical protein QXZ17_15780 [Nitrososphaerota archaeon]|uniref:hypothetical protein n=1 Tax=Thermofilum sp. TaxID=1961369 RepID=UPI00316BA04A